MRSLLDDFVNDESGATAIEYGLLMGFISLAILGALSLMGTNLKIPFQKLADNMK